MEIAQLTDVGERRHSNQDQAGVFYNQDDEPILLLCDGMGGHNAGDVASEMALYQVGVAWEKTTHRPLADVKSWLNTTIKATNQRVLEQSMKYQDLSGMGTTLVCFVPQGKTGMVAHVGDSRLYQCHEDEMIQLTKDHSYVQELVDSDMITQEQARNHPQKNIVTQSIGVTEEVNVSFSTVDITPGDLYILCSDGLSDMLEDDEILGVLENTADLNMAVQELVDRANQAGGFDNITVLLMRAEGGETE
ncbi:MAG: Stp1/IreP family PP2C-type Ser/Thr phosphatase [Aerococcus sp.]|nr:Stp1/IreP family PP2C-type Ser/Thr phosphatase [Aerococcus sp.]